MPAANPEFVRKSLERGRALIDRERWLEAEPVYDDLIELDPGNVVVRYDYATVKLGLGACETALETFDDLVRSGNDRAAIRFMRARAYLELGEVDKGIADLENAYSREATDYCLRALANAYWMQGNRTAFEALLTPALRHPLLLGAAADMLRQSGQTDRCIAEIGAARQNAAISADALAVLTQAYLDANKPGDAERAARDGLAAARGDDALTASLISALLMQGKADQALEMSLQMRKAQPDRQHWIAYEATAYRLLGDDRYGPLVDLERFVRAYSIPVPSGFDAIDGFNAALLESLGRWQPHALHPLNQTLRHGSQTTRELTAIPDPVIEAYIAALDEPIRAYMRSVGTGKNHPLTARNTGEYRIAGSWSVRLRGGGRHVNHVHPEGWISSAYYVSVPKDVEDESSKAGWIKFGEPPFACVPPAPPQKWIKPTAGTLVLFPSYLWHGTEPILDDSERVTAPFDVVPA